ncbi:extracellular solute-binding protein [Streptomyces sp. NPDC006356]
MNHSSRLTRRTLRAVGLTCSVFALTLSAGCAGDSSGSGGKTVIRFNWWGSDSRHEMTKQMIAVFEKEHPNIDVQPEYSNWDDYWKKLSTGAAAGDMPDVLQLTDPYMYSYIDNGQLMDLKKVKDVLHTDKLPANSMAMTTVKGGLYGVPGGDSGFGIVADPAAFKKAGVPMPDDTKWSWDDYVKTAAALSKGQKGLVGSEMPLYTNDLGTWLRQHGEDYWTKDGSKIGFSEETVAAYWEWVVKLRDSGGTTSPEAAVEKLSSGAGVEQGLVAQHKAAMSDLSVTQLGAIEGASGRETKLLLFPGENGASQVGAYTKPGIFYGASARTEHPKEAAQLLDFLVNSTEAAKIQKFDRGVPNNPDVLKAITPELSPVEKRIADYLNRVNALKPTALHIPNAEAGPAVPEIFQRLNEDVLFDRVSPQEAAEKFISEIKSQL